MKGAPAFSYVLGMIFAVTLCHCKPLKVHVDDRRLRGITGDAIATAFVPAATTTLPAAFSPPILAKPGVPVCGGATLASSQSQSAQKALASASGLSRAYLDGCAGCHGWRGEGNPLFPPLPGAVADADAFQKVIRQGRNGMPAFTGAAISDGDLKADFATLLRGVAASPQNAEGVHDVELAKPTSIADAEFMAIMGRGLAAWRLPGDKGSCASCHGPDGIDLARVGYTRGDILRRASGQGRSGDEGQSIADMIDALRRRYKIEVPCSPVDFAPMQPGGHLLSGRDAKDVDAQLGAALEREGVRLGQSPKDYAAARQLADAIEKIDPRSIAIGIALNPWTADGFHGPRQTSTAEWIPELAMEARDQAHDDAWVALENRYLESPTDKNFWALYDGVEDLGAQRFVASDGIAERLSREKFRSVLLFQHMMRRDDATLPDLAVAANLPRFSVWEVGQVGTVFGRGCAEDGTETGDNPFPCWGYRPQFFEKMGRDRDALLLDAQRLILPWLTTGFLLDPALQFTENGDAQILHWHQALIDAASTAGLNVVSGDLPLHHLYFGAVRMTRAVDAYDPQFGNGREFSQRTINGCWDKVQAGLGQYQGATLHALSQLGVEATESAAERATLAINRMIILLAQHSLSSPEPACKAAASPGANLKSIITSIGAWGAKVAGSAANVELAATVVGLIK